MGHKKVISLHEFARKQKNFVFKDGKKQILILGLGQDIFALDNRCPHEGYPLSLGPLDPGNCTLTCQWHNWKFDLKTGKCLVGADHVKTYPVKVEEGVIWVDTQDLDPHIIKNQILEGLKTAFEKRQYGRIGREITRLILNGLDPLDAAMASLQWSWNKFESGMTHAHAAFADWLQLYADFPLMEDRVICLTEALDYLSFESLRQPSFPFADTLSAGPWDEDQFREAIEKEDEALAVALLKRAFADGKNWEALERTFFQSALRHYNDFGHSLIYTQKTGFLTRYFPGERDLALKLIMNLVRSLILATREDLLPEFADYSQALLALEKVPPGTRPLSPSLSSAEGLKWMEEFQENRVGATLERVRELYGTYRPEDLFHLLLTLTAGQLLSFDTTYEWRKDSLVKDNVGWLDFTHALTFGHAVWTCCQRYPELWPQGLLQLACFYGRNSPYTSSFSSSTSGTFIPDKWFVLDQEAFRQEVREKILDHGTGLPIFSTHYLKTAQAVFSLADEATCPPFTKKWLLAGLNRYLHSPQKTKHVRRMAKQAIHLVSRDF